jgi:hypothetical protein
MFSLQGLFIFFYVELIFISLFIIGYFIPFFSSKIKKTNSLIFGNSNIGLSILIASKFFSPQILLIVFMGEISFILNQGFISIFLKNKEK